MADTLENAPPPPGGSRLLNLSFEDSLAAELFCYFSQPGYSIFVTYLLINSILLLPLSVLILSHGFKEGRGKRSSPASSSTASAVSHVDSFTYALAGVELVGVSGCILITVGLSCRPIWTVVAGFMLLFFCGFGETFFHLLTSVERYLAVVHPVRYLSLRGDRWVRFRNATIATVVLLSLALVGALIKAFLIVYLTLGIIVLSVTAMSYFSVSVLYALTAPGPGDNGTAKKRVDPAKKRAFYTILVILMTMLLRFVWSLAWAGYLTHFMTISNCVILTSEVWFHLPSSLALPLLFLHRKGQLAFLKCSFLTAKAPANASQ